MTNSTVSGFWEIIWQGQRTVSQKMLMHGQKTPPPPQIAFVSALANALAAGTRLVNGVLLAVGSSTLQDNITNIVPNNQLVDGDNVTLGGAFVRALAPVPLDIRDAATNISSTVCFCRFEQWLLLA